MPGMKDRAHAIISKLRPYPDAAVLFAAMVGAGCTQDPAVAPDMSLSRDLSAAGDLAPGLYLSQPDITPRTLFDTLAFPSLAQSCQPCHAVAQGAVPPFLATGMEYQSITGYKSGAFVNVPASTQSLLVQKGAHTGPASTPAQYAAVHG